MIEFGSPEHFLKIEELLNRKDQEIDRLREQCKGLAQSALNNGQDLLLKEAEIERLRRESAGLELECAAWRQSSALKLDEIERLHAELRIVRQVAHDAADKIEQLRAARQGTDEQPVGS